MESAASLNQVSMKSQRRLVILGKASCISAEDETTILQKAEGTCGNANRTPSIAGHDGNAEAQMMQCCPHNVLAFISPTSFAKDRTLFNQYDALIATQIHSNRQLGRATKGVLYPSSEQPRVRGLTFKPDAIFWCQFRKRTRAHCAFTSTSTFILGMFIYTV